MGWKLDSKSRMKYIGEIWDEKLDVESGTKIQMWNLG